MRHQAWLQRVRPFEFEADEVELEVEEDEDDTQISARGNAGGGAR